MKILYDSQCFDMQKSGGISRYFVEIMQNLPNTFNYFLNTKYSENIYLNEIMYLPDNPTKHNFDSFFNNLDFPGKWHLLQIRNKLFYKNFKTNREHDIEALMQQDFDIFHPTYYDPYFLDYLGNKPFVLTIHDMIHEKYPEMLLDVNTINNKKLLANKAKHIIAISENTKKDIIELLNVPEKKISVIYHGTSKTFKDRENLNDFGKYLLFTGARNNYKNFYFMLLSIADWLHEHPDVKLICTSVDFSKFEKDFIKELNLEKQVIHKFFYNDDEMYDLYHNSIAFIFPSYYEGFGIPILEAFEAKCPVILASESSFTEIAGNAAAYFTSKNKLQLVEVLDKIYNNAAYRNKLINNGIKRLESFSWKNSAEATAKIYSDILSNIL